MNAKPGEYYLQKPSEWEDSTSQLDENKKP